MNWFWKVKIKSQSVSDCTDSILHDENTFYNSFTHDLLQAKEEVIIESPFITIGRVLFLKPILQKLVIKKVKIYVITRVVEEQSDQMQYQAEKGIDILEEIGVIVATETGNIHRKIAMIDRKVSWEGSLNILSQSHSREFMKRIENKIASKKLFDFLKLDMELNLL